MYTSTGDVTCCLCKNIQKGVDGAMQLFQLKHSFVLLVAHNGSKIVAGMNFRTKRIEEVQCHVVPQNCFICLSVIFHLDWMHPGVKNSFSDNPICSAMGQVEQLNLHAVAESRKP